MTSRLRGRFPFGFRKLFCKKSLIRGAVLRAYTELTVPPKIKLFVVWGLEESLNKVGISFINSEITSVKKQWLQDLQHPLLLKNNSFLTHNSFLDCSRIHEKDLNIVRDLLTDDIDILLGNISSGDLLTCENLIRNAKTIEIKLKKRYGFI